MRVNRQMVRWAATLFILVSLGLVPHCLLAAEKLVGLYAARVIAQSMPWIAQEAGLFQKYNLDFQLVYIASGPLVSAAMIGGDGEVAVTGGEGIIRGFVQGATDLVFIGAVKNMLTHSILGKPELKRPEDLKGKKIGVVRIGAAPHYFAVQVLRRNGLDPVRDVTFIQTGGDPEALAALVSGSIDAAVLTAPADVQAIAQGLRYTVYGPDLRIPYASTVLATQRAVIAKRSHVVGQFMRVMAEAAKVLHTDRELTYRVLGKQLRLDDRKILGAAYDAEIKALEPRLDIQPVAIQAVLEEVSKVNLRAKRVKPEDLIDRRYLDEMEKSGFFDKVWATKR